MLDDSSLVKVCERLLGARLATVLFRSGHLSQVIGVELTDGRTAVLKVRPDDSRIAGCTAVQAHLARAGFPCPVPLAGPVVTDALAVTAETLIPGGRQLPAAHGAAPYARLLAWFVRSAPAAASVPSLAPSPPWTAWDHPGARLWPDLDDHGRDLNEVRGPAWVDDAARRVRQRMRDCGAPPRIGHGDWESQNIRWSGQCPLAVHDWDSVIAQPEAAIAGLAAAVWPAGGEAGHAATVEQSADFIASYQVAVGTRWNERDIQHAWAAGLWVRLFNAKKDAGYADFPELDRLAGEIDERLALAACGLSLSGMSSLPAPDQASLGRHQPLKPHQSRLYDIQRIIMGFTWRLCAMRRVLGAIAPISPHVAQIHHLIWHTLNASTCRHTRRLGEQAFLPSATQPGTNPPLSLVRGLFRVRGDHREAPLMATHAPDRPRRHRPTRQ